MARIETMDSGWRAIVKVCLPLMLLFLGQTAAAQSVLGVTVVDGKRVELLDDRTWRYADTAEARSGDCTSLNPVIEFCTGEWRPSQVPSPDFLAAYRLNDRTYGGIIHEALGTSSGINHELLRRVTIRFAAGAAGVPESQIPILEIRESQVDGHDTETMAYTFDINNLTVVYQNTYFISENTTIQFIVWTIGEAYTDAEKAVAADFLDKVKLHPEAQ